MKTTPVKIDANPVLQFFGEALSRHFPEEAAKLAAPKEDKKGA